MSWLWSMFPPKQHADGASDEEINHSDEGEDITAAVDTAISGFSDLEYVYGTSDESLYTLIGTHTESGVRKRLRFAPGNRGRARLRLQHELNVLKMLEEYDVPQIPQIEQILDLPDRSLCVVYQFLPVKTFQEYLESITNLQWDERIGEVLKFARSVTVTLSAMHLAGVFRAFC
jgi:hypothetical protein